MRLLEKRRGELSGLQLSGFVLVVIGLLFLLLHIANWYVLSGDKIAIVFFILMMGIAFIFPELLQDQSKGVSTMRIVVFMMVNVICILLLKMGWNCTNLISIGLNQYWVGVIAFVFGSKATQSFFESRMAVAASQERIKNPPDLPPDKRPSDVGCTPGSVPIAGPGNAPLAIQQCGQTLKEQCPNIVLLLPAYYFDGNNRVPCVDVCISDNNKERIPAFLSYTLNGSPTQIKTRIIVNYMPAKAQVGRGNLVVNSASRDCLGTVGCIVAARSSPSLFLLTCNHVMNGGHFANPSAFGDEADEPVYGKYLNIGTWVAGKMDNTMDAALVQLADPSYADPNDIGISPYIVSDNDCSNTIAELNGGMSNIKQGYIIHINQPFQIRYSNRTVEIDNLISISSSRDANHFGTLTQEGDSGSLVYHATTRQPIGMVIGGNAQFTYAIPINSVLAAFTNYNLTIN